MASFLLSIYFHHYFGLKNCRLLANVPNKICATHGDISHRAHEQLTFFTLLNLAQIILLVFYILTYFVYHTFKN